MKSFSAILFSAGLVSAVQLASPIAINGGQLNGGQISSGQIDASQQAQALQAAAQQLQGAAASGIVNNVNASAAVNASDAAAEAAIGSGDANAIESGLNLGDMTIGGLNLGSVDLSSQNDLLNAIGLMSGALCLGNVFDVNSLSGLSGGADLQLFLELAQLMELQQSGLVNLLQIQSLFNTNSLFGAGGNLNFGVFKRAVAETKRSATRTKTLRRGVRARQVQNNCAAINGGANVGADQAAVASPAVSAAVIAPPAAAATEAAAAAPAAAAPEADEDLSDFTR